MKFTALLAGATGLVGRECLRLLARDEHVAEPLRSGAPGADDAALVEADLRRQLTRIEHQRSGANADYEYPLAIAKAARARGASHFLLVSALGANARSGVFYNRVKGELEEAVQALGFLSVTIVRPSMLVGDREVPRFGEEVAKRVGWLVPPRWRPVQASQVALALVNTAHENAPGVRILENAALRAAA